MILPTQLSKKSIIVLTNIYKCNCLFCRLPLLTPINDRYKARHRSHYLINLIPFRSDQRISKHQIYIKQMTSTNPKSTNLIDRDVVNEMIENAIRRHNRRSTIISAILGWILIGGYSFGLFHVVQNI